MTIKLFWQDPYLAACDTVITGVRAAEVCLRETVFFPFTGGQESDQGTIAGFPVQQAEKRGLEIFYLLPTEHGLLPGQPVRVEIDWQRRYRLMRLHFAAELVLELTTRGIPGIEKTGAHISVGKARLDFGLQESIAPHLPGVLAKAQAIIAQDLAITSAFSNKEAERRYWEIEGFARVSCGGTHLHRTGEVGPLRLKRENPGRGRERIEIFLEDEHEMT
jgi:Ser-tRNA(Ala) deacylase AlaX